MVMDCLSIDFVADGADSDVIALEITIHAGSFSRFRISRTHLSYVAISR